MNCRLYGVTSIVCFRYVKELCTISPTVPAMNCLYHFFILASIRSERILQEEFTCVAKVFDDRMKRMRAVRGVSLSGTGVVLSRNP
jgi:hypothetical protein